jgi:hypothetical protein
MKRWIGYVLIGLALLGCSTTGNGSAGSPLDAWAQAVADNQAAQAATFMQPPPDDWAFQVSKVHRYPVTGYRVARPLTPAPDGQGQVATVVWERQSDDPLLQYACIRTVRVQGEKIVVGRDTVGICTATGDQ